VESDGNERAQESNRSGWKPDDTAGWEARRYGQHALRLRPKICGLPFAGPAS
jgi:hypothetical protein